MKIKNIFLSLAAATLLLTACGNFVADSLRQ